MPGPYTVINDLDDRQQVTEFPAFSVEDALEQYHREVFSGEREAVSVTHIICPDGELVIPWTVTGDFPLPQDAVVRWNPFDGMYWVVTDHPGEIDTAWGIARRHGHCPPPPKGV